VVVKTWRNVVIHGKAKEALFILPDEINALNST
jgi:hypothetical protein